jgi:hypothetical protein
MKSRLWSLSPQKAIWLMQSQIQRQGLIPIFHRYFLSSVSYSHSNNRMDFNLISLSTMSEEKYTGDLNSANFLHSDVRGNINESKRCN